MKKPWYILVIIVLLSGCSNKIKEEPVILDDFITKLNEERKTDISMPLENAAKDYALAYDNELNLDYDELMKLTTPADIANITKDEAKEDVDMLFRLLRASYGAYGYFGGDEVFNNAKKEIEKEISLKDTLKRHEFLLILLENLSFLEDTHFSLNGYNTFFNEIYLYVENENREFHKDTYGYYIKIDNEKWYLEKEKEALLKLTIGESGELVYGLFALSSKEESKGLSGNITLKCGRESLHYDLTWEIASIGEPLGKQDDVYYYDEMEGIPVASIRAMIAGDDEIEDTLQFIRDAEKMRDKEVAILDLRMNGGGFPEINELWLYKLTDHIVLPNMEVLNRINNLPTGRSKGYDIGKNLVSYKYELDFYTDYSLLRHELNNDLINVENSDYYTIDKYKPRFIDRDNTLFVLVDKNTYSASEMFMLQLKTVGNVIFVGTNSNGCILTGNVLRRPYYLPNSRISVAYGTSLSVTGYMYELDARGFLPDIYINSEEAIDAVIRCKKYYDINKNLMK